MKDQDRKKISQWISFKDYKRVESSNYSSLNQNEDQYYTHFTLNFCLPIFTKSTESISGLPFKQATPPPNQYPRTFSLPSEPVGDKGSNMGFTNG